MSNSFKSFFHNFLSNFLIDITGLLTPDDLSMLMLIGRPIEISSIGNKEDGRWTKRCAGDVKSSQNIDFFSIPITAPSIFSNKTSLFCSVGIFIVTFESYNLLKFLSCTESVIAPLLIRTSTCFPSGLVRRICG